MRLQATPVTPLPTRPELRIVEQITYRCENLRKGWKPLPSIDFTVLGQGGINLTNAINRNFSDLEGRNDPVSEDKGIKDPVVCIIDVRGRYYIASCVPQSLRSISSWDSPRTVK